MSRHRRKSRIRQIKRLILFPFASFLNNLIGLKDLIVQAFVSLGFSKSIPRRRNRDFELAGKEEPLRSFVDPVAAANLRNAQHLRTEETIRAATKENKLLKGRSKNAEEFRQNKVQEKSSVSQGSVVSHLASMQQKAKEKANERAKKVETKERDLPERE